VDFFTPAHILPCIFRLDRRRSQNSFQPA
jgi:hypothetical protein